MKKTEIVVQLLGTVTMVVLLLTISAVASHGRRPSPMKPLRLDGEVVDVKLDRGRQKQIVHLKVKLKFTNTGEKPVILLLGTYGENKHWWILDTTASRTLSDALDGKPFYIGPTVRRIVSLCLNGRNSGAS